MSRPSAPLGAVETEYACTARCLFDGPTVQYRGESRNLFVDSVLAVFDPRSRQYADEYWLGLGWNACTKHWYIEKLFTAVHRLVTVEHHSVPLICVITDSQLAAREADYDSGVVYGMHKDALYSVLTGADSSWESFLKAEGLLLRCALASTSFEQRMAFVKMWAIAYWRRAAVGSKPLKLLCDTVRMLDKVYEEEQYEPCAGGRGFMKGMQKLLRYRAVYNGYWLTVFECMRTLRDVAMAEPAFDVNVCMMHGAYCPVEESDSEGSESEGDEESEEDGPEEPEYFELPAPLLTPKWK